jgi:tetratricopeptide (TPR) repeat protein
VADVRKSGDDLVITARLVNADDGFQLWSNRYERAVADVFDVQAHIVQSIVDELNPESNGSSDGRSFAAPTTNAMAHDKYLWGEFNLDRRTSEGAADAVDNFTMSIGFDSAFAVAHAGLAEAQLALLSYSNGSSDSDLLETAARVASTALRLDPDLARARVALGSVNMYRLDWTAAEAEYVRALELAPEDPLVRQRYAELQAALGRFSSALNHAARAADRDPRSTGPLRTLLRIHRANGNIAQAIRAGQRILTLNANDPATWLDLSLLFLAEGRAGDPANALERYAELSGMDVVPFRAFIAAAEAHAESGAVGNVPVRVAEFFSDRPVQLAVLFQLVGRSDGALDVLERAHRGRHPDLANLIMRPELAALYDAPRFRAIVADVGLTSPGAR